MRMRVRYLASLSGLRIWHFSELQCRSQTQLGSEAVVWAGGTAPIGPLAWELPYASDAALKRQKKKKKKGGGLYDKTQIFQQVLLHDSVKNIL